MYNPRNDHAEVYTLQCDSLIYLTVFINHIFIFWLDIVSSFRIIVHSTIVFSYRIIVHSTIVFSYRIIVHLTIVSSYRTNVNLV